MVERLVKRVLVYARERLTDKKRAHRVNIAPDRLRTQLERFSKSCAAAHERIEDDFSRKVMMLVKRIPGQRPLRVQCCENDSPENRTQAGGPPFVNMIERPTYLF